LKEQHQRKEALSYDLCAINTYKLGHCTTEDTIINNQTRL